MSREAFEKGVKTIIESDRRAGGRMTEDKARKMMQDGANYAHRVASETGKGRLARNRGGER